jgi:hypothetical protein
MRDRGLRYWLPSYAGGVLQRRRLRAARARTLTHIIFLVCDHFEPRHAVRQPEQAAERLRAWHSGYKALQDECVQRWGMRPVHTWFYPPHHGDEHLPALAHMAFDGLGEVELHYHHDGDTADSLRREMQLAVSRYRRAGLLLQLGEPPPGRFGFIHGDWALDNSAGGRFCGVNGELSLLRGLGCWADLTLPSANECQTRKINSIYYAVDSPARAKSHDSGEDARVGRTDRQGLMLIQGPLGLNFADRRLPRVENASLTSDNWGTPGRIATWIDCHVHVRGRPEWLFVKLHTHGAIERDFDALFGDKARRMYATLAERYHDGKAFKVHCVTARQAYNLIRAAEAGASGDPADFLDWEIPPQVTSRYCADKPHDLRGCTAGRLSLSGFDADTPATVMLRYPGLRGVSGRLLELEVLPLRARIQVPTQRETIHLQLDRGARLQHIAGGTLLREGEGSHVTIECGGETRIELTAETGLGVTA